MRDEAAGRLWETLYGLLDDRQRRALDQLLEVPDGARYSKLDRWRTGPAKPSGKSLERALARAAEVQALGFRASDLAAVVPPRRLAEMGRCGHRWHPGYALLGAIGVIIACNGRGMRGHITAKKCRRSTKLAHAQWSWHNAGTAQ